MTIYTRELFEQSLNDIMLKYLTICNCSLVYIFDLNYTRSITHDDLDIKLFTKDTITNSKRLHRRGYKEINKENKKEQEYKKEEKKERRPYYYYFIFL